MIDAARVGAGLDLVGFGAFNIDYIASASRLSQAMDDSITESTARFEWNREGPVGQEAIMEAIRNLGAASLSCSLGGSAWLTIFTLANLGIDIRLGYVGVLGRVETPGLSFIDQMDELKVDRSMIGRYPDQACGLCLSYIDDTDRVMLTHPGANYEMHRYLKENFDAVAAYLASARFVHVTSFLDENTPRQVLRVLTRAKELNPAMRISFDPGYDWAAHPGEDVEGILAVTDLLFVNYREFKALGRYIHGESDEIIARKVLARCSPHCIVFVTKRYDFTESFQYIRERLAAQRFRLRRPLRDAELEDATGAGDVFAAAVLSSLISNQLHVELGAYLGLSLARQKLARPGAGGRALPIDLSNGFLQQAEPVSVVKPNTSDVFLVHHQSPYRDQVIRFVRDECGVRVRELDTAGVAEHEVRLATSDMVDQGSFAICLLHCDETMQDGRSRADQSIIYQAGVFQGRYGFGRVALLAEEGCDTFSNIAGVVRLDFPQRQVDTTFFELRRMLLREGLLTQHRERPHG